MRGVYFARCSYRILGTVRDYLHASRAGIVYVIEQADHGYSRWEKLDVGDSLTKLSS